MMPMLSFFPLFVDTRRVSVYSVMSGNPKNPPILFIHGWGLSPRSYADYLVKVSDSLSVDVIAPALPGFGGSDPLPSDADEGHLIEHLFETVSQLGFDAPPIMAGHSLGGALATRLASSTEFSLDPRMLLVSPAGVYHQEQNQRGLSDALAMALDLRYELPNSPLQRLRDAGPSFLRHPRAVLQAGWTAAHIDIRDDLAKLTKAGYRIHLVTADEDHVTPYEAAIQVPDVLVERVHGSHGWLLSSANDAAQLTARLLSS